jgi:hypothetical protein
MSDLKKRLTLVHTEGRSVEVEAAGVQLFSYVYNPVEIPIEESPKPYFHPLKTLQGNVMTNLRANDHPWHHALAMTVTLLDGFNFWGGPTYADGKGYLWAENHGRQKHLEWKVLSTSDDGTLQMEESLLWETLKGEGLLSETRHIGIPEISVEEGYWILDFATELENISGRDLTFGNYHSSEGLKGSHYTGLLFRMAREFVYECGDPEIKLLATNGLDGEDAVHGASSPWLAMVGRHDETLDRSTVLFLDRPENETYPSHWFVRRELPCVAYTFQYDKDRILKEGETLNLSYRMVIANGAWSREKIEAFVASQ